MDIGTFIAKSYTRHCALSFQINFFYACRASLTFLSCLPTIVFAPGLSLMLSSETRGVLRKYCKALSAALLDDDMSFSFRSVALFIHPLISHCLPWTIREGKI